MNSQGQEVHEQLYYCPKSLNLKYLIIDGAPEIFYSEVGFVEQTFTDADFAGLNTCDATNLFLSDNGRNDAVHANLRGLILY